MRTNTVLLILAALQAAIIAWVSTREAPSRHADARRGAAIFEQWIGRSQVSGVDVIDGDSSHISLRWSPAESAWVVASHQNYPADPADVDGLLSKLFAASFVREVTRNPLRYEPLLVADHNFEAKLALHGVNGPLGEMWVGKAAFGSTFVRWKDAVYEVELANFHHNLSTQITSWIEPLAFQEKEPIEAIDLLWDSGETLNFKRQDGKWKTSDPLFVVNGPMVDALVKNASEIRIVGVHGIETEPRHGLSPARLEIALHKKGGVRRLSVGGPSADSSEYFLKLDSRKHIVSVRPWKRDELCKTPDDFRKKDPTGGYLSDFEAPALESVTRLPSGLGYVEDRVGGGHSAQSGMEVGVRYAGWLQDGTHFDSNLDGDLFRFVLGQGMVIRGWEEGISGMKVGGRRTLVIPPELGYGEAGSGPIPPKATLIFKVELFELSGQGADAPDAPPAPSATENSADISDLMMLLPSGLKYLNTQPGKGPAIKAGDRVWLRFKTRLQNGTVVADNTGDENASVFTVGQNQVMRGFDEAVLGMRVGGARLLIIPPDLAYGEAGTSDGLIPAKATLIAEISIEKAESGVAVPTPPPSPPPAPVEGVEAQISILDGAPGEGPEAELGAEIDVSYQVWTSNGRKVDGTGDTPRRLILGQGGLPFEFALRGLRPGGSRMVVIPAPLVPENLGYPAGQSLIIRIQRPALPTPPPEPPGPAPDPTPAPDPEPAPPAAPAEDSGLTVYDNLLGEGPAAEAGSRLRCRYTLWLAGGKRVESNVEDPAPFEFTLGAGQVIQGWELGLRGMRQGGSRMLMIPAHLAYGDKGTPDGAIPPRTSLIFKVELVEVLPPLMPTDPPPADSSGMGGDR